MKASSFARPAVALLFVLCGWCLCLGTYASPKPAASGYHLIKTIPLPPAPGDVEYFDYITVDAEARRVYVSHRTEMVVLNADDYTVVGKIGDLKLCHGVALVKELGKGFITDGDAEKVVIFDIKSLKITGEIKTNQPDTDSILYDPASKFLFTINGHSANTTVIDPVKEVVVKNIELGGNNVETAVADGKGMVYGNNVDKNDIVAIDSRELQIKTRWPVAPEGQPTSMGMDRKNRRLFSGGRGPQMLVMIDADSGKVIQSLPITAGVDATIFEPETGMLFVSTREGMLHIYHEDTPNKLSEVETIKTEYGAKTMGLDSKTHNLYLSTSDFNPPAEPSEKQPHPLPRAKQGNFRVLVYGR
jgi:uncharacterized protein YjiK